MINKVNEKSFNDELVSMGRIQLSIDNGEVKDSGQLMKVCTEYNLPYACFNRLDAHLQLKVKTVNNINTVTYMLPTWAGCLLIDNDSSGVFEEDEAALNEWIDHVMSDNDYDSFHCVSVDVEGEKFAHSNDLKNLGDNVCEFTFQYTVKPSLQTFSVHFSACLNGYSVQEEYIKDAIVRDKDDVIGYLKILHNDITIHSITKRCDLKLHNVHFIAKEKGAIGVSSEWTITLGMPEGDKDYVYCSLRPNYDHIHSIVMTKVGK